MALVAAALAVAVGCGPSAGHADAEPVLPPGPDAMLSVPMDGALPRCRPGTCAGCCADSNTCVAGTDQSACGSGGIVCDSCSQNATCTRGRCVSPCGPNTCAGCCDKTGACVGGNKLDACGSGGMSCAACGSTQSCSSGKCVNTSCMSSCSGCCDSSGCEGGGADSACGSGGAACTVCGTNQTCASGACIVAPNSQWDIVAVSAQLSATDANGNSWDPFGGLPDGYMYVEAGGNAEPMVTGQSKTICDTLSPSWNQTILSGVTARTLFDHFQISVYDQDDFSPDDLMCTATDLKNSFFDAMVMVVCTNGTTFLYRIKAH